MIAHWLVIKTITDKHTLIQRSAIVVCGNQEERSLRQISNANTYTRVSSSSYTQKSVTELGGWQYLPMEPQ